MRKGWNLPFFIVVGTGMFLFVCLPAKAQSFQFVQLCDPQLCRMGCEPDMAMLELAIDYINALNPDFVLVGGDLADLVKTDGTLDEFMTACQGLHVPLHCIPGNNDIGVPVNVGMLEDFRHHIGLDWWSFVHKGIFFVGVNTQLWQSDTLPQDRLAQDVWLENTLTSAHEAGHSSIVVGHSPLFFLDPFEGYDVSYNIPELTRGMLMDWFETKGVIGYLAGHLHLNFVRPPYKGVLYAITASTCVNRDKSPLGFRLWTVDMSKTPLTADSLSSQYIDLQSYYENNRDTDNDGLPVRREDRNRNAIVEQGETDRRLADTDGDGIDDGTEVKLGMNPLVQDADQLTCTTITAVMLGAMVISVIGAILLHRRFVSR